jgi:hypothetical protein
VIGSSPYKNGAYLVSNLTGAAEEHTLYCSCGMRAPSIRWSDLKPCVVPNRAYTRGFGPPEDIILIADHPAMS